MEGNLTSMGTPLWACLPEKEKIKATSKRDKTAIPALPIPYVGVTPGFFTGS